MAAAVSTSLTEEIRDARLPYYWSGNEAETLPESMLRRPVLPLTEVPPNRLFQLRS